MQRAQLSSSILHESPRSSLADTWCLCAGSLQLWPHHCAPERSCQGIWGSTGVISRPDTPIFSSCHVPHFSSLQPQQKVHYRGIFVINEQEASALQRQAKSLAPSKQAGGCHCDEEWVYRQSCHMVANAACPRIVASEMLL